MPTIGTVSADNLTGSSDADVILGLEGNDTLNGGDGDDFLSGDEGDDVLDGGFGNDFLIDSSGINTLNGGAGDDVLIGGSGANKLTGGAGADTFRFTSLETSAQRDTVTDFTSGIDRIEIVTAAFGPEAVAASGALDQAALAFGTEATTAEHRFIYDQASGVLSYDADGLGGQAQVDIAVLTNRPALLASDLFLI